MNTAGGASITVAGAALLTLVFLMFWRRGAGPLGIFVAACCGAMIPLFSGVAILAFRLGGVGADVAEQIASALSGVGLG
jgi:hypothetical protein